MKILLDTSIIIDFVRQKEKQDTILHLLAYKQEKIYISIVTHSELHSGRSIWENKKAKKELDQIFSNIVVLPINIEISTLAGRIKAKKGIDLLDAIIAATAISNNIPLVTLNQKHFRSIEHLRLL